MSLLGNPSLDSHAAAAFSVDQTAAAEIFFIVEVAENVGLTLNSLISSVMFFFWFFCRFLFSHCCEYVFPTPLS